MRCRTCGRRRRSSCCPAQRRDVQAVVRRVRREGVPFVARGHGTGLSGGALPVPGGVVISLARLNRVLDVDIPESARHRRARRHQPGNHPAGRAVRLLLRARSLEPAGLLDWRQRRGELRRRALPEVRIHGASRPGSGGRAPRRRDGADRQPRSPTRPDPICSASSSGAKARSPSSPKRSCGSSAGRRACRRCSRPSTASARREPPSPTSSAPASSRPRWR